MIIIKIIKIIITIIPTIIQISIPLILSNLCIFILIQILSSDLHPDHPLHPLHLGLPRPRLSPVLPVGGLGYLIRHVLLLHHSFNGEYDDNSGDDSDDYDDEYGGDSDDANRQSGIYPLPCAFASSLFNGEQD